MIMRAAKRVPKLLSRHTVVNVSKIRRFCSKTDDEFTAPTSFVSDGELSFLWSSEEYNNILRLDSDSFTLKKDTIASFPKIRIMKVEHKDKGAITFLIIQCSDLKWRIANTLLIGEECNIDPFENGPISCVVQYMSHYNLQDKDSLEENCLVAPYHLIESPNASKMDEYYIQSWEGLNEKGHAYIWYTYPKVLICSQNHSWLSSVMTTYSPGGKELSTVNKLFLMVNDPFLGWRISLIVLANM